MLASEPQILRERTSKIAQASLKNRASEPRKLRKRVLNIFASEC